LDLPKTRLGSNSDEDLMEAVRVTFALKHPAELEHYVPAGERVPA
jgi:hypothetical protein